MSLLEQGMLLVADVIPLKISIKKEASTDVPLPEHSLWMSPETHLIHPGHVPLWWAYLLFFEEHVSGTAFDRCLVRRRRMPDRVHRLQVVPSSAASDGKQDAILKTPSAIPSTQVP